MSECIKCHEAVETEDEKTLCLRCVTEICQRLSPEECLDIMCDVATKVRRGEAVREGIRRAKSASRSQGAGDTI